MGGDWGSDQRKTMEQERHTRKMGKTKDQSDASPSIDRAT